MPFLISQFLFLFFVLVGIIVWASSDLPMAVREIALNSRKDPAHGSTYNLIKVLSICLKIFAVLLWILGIVLAVTVGIAGSSLENFLSPPAL